MRSSDIRFVSMMDLREFAEDPPQCVSRDICRLHHLGNIVSLSAYMSCYVVGMGAGNLRRNAVLPRMLYLYLYQTYTCQKFDFMPRLAESMRSTPCNSSKNPRLVFHDRFFCHGGPPQNPENCSWSHCIHRIWSNLGIFCISHVILDIWDDTTPSGTIPNASRSWGASRQVFDH